MPAQKSLMVALGVASSALVLLFAFQNCGQDLSGAKASASGYSTGVAFPLAAKADLFGYMSCDRMPTTYNRSQYFTFRVKSSGGSSGVQPSSAFEQFIASSGYNLANQMAVVTNSAYSGATLQLALRTVSNSSVYLTATGTAADTSSTVNNWGSLTGSANLQTILTNGTAGTRTLNGTNLSLQVAANGDNIGGHTDANAAAGLIQNIVQNQVELVLGFTSSRFNSGSTPLNPSASIGPGSYNINAYGTEFEPTFSKPFVSAGTQSNLAGQGYNSISALSELDLSTQPATNIPGWVCQGSANQFMILPAVDASATRAGCMTPSQAQAKTYSAAESLRRYNAANAILNDGVANQNWIIDANNNCIFPSQGGSLACYDSDNNGALDGPFVANAGEACGGAGQGLCPHYFTFCSATR